MIARLINKNNNWYCSNCLIQQSSLQENCSFCGNWFSNYNEERLKIRDMEEENFREEKRKEWADFQS